MPSGVQNILDNVIGSGARNTKFECMIYFSSPNLFKKTNDLYALVKTSQFPGKSHDIIDLKYKGRTIPIKGQVKYDGTWSCTFYLTEDHELKIAFENWIDSLDYHKMKEVNATVKQAEIDNLYNYTSTMWIAQNDFHGENQTALYELRNCFPKSISAIDVDYSNVGNISEFTVEFSYSYYNVYSVKNNTVSNIDSESKNFISNIASGMNSLIQSALSDVDAAINNITNSLVSEIQDGVSFIGNSINSMASSYDN